MPSLRAFVALPLPERTTAALAAATEQLALPCKRAGLTVGWVPERNLHLTLQFLGSVRDADLLVMAQALREQLADVPAPTLGLRSLGAFPSPSRPRVLYGAVEEADAVVALQRRVAAVLQDLGHAPDGKPFHPHVTIGRVRSGRGVGELLAPFAGRRFGEPAPVGTITLFESQLGGGSPQYVPWAQVPLAGA